MITTFSAPDAAAPIGPYSHGVQCWGKMIFLSGQIPLRADGTMLDGSIEEQTAQVFTNIKTILATRGAALQHVVKTTVFLIPHPTHHHHHFFQTHRENTCAGP